MGLVGAGCSFLPEPQTDPTRFYVLAAPDNGGPPVANAPTVHLGPVELASYLRARPIIVRRGENEVEFREFARWGEALEIGIARVLREELLARGGASAVLQAGSRRSHAAHHYDLNVRVLAAEGDVSGAVLFRAVWELTPPGSKPGEMIRGEYRARDQRWDGKNEAVLAAELSKAVSALAAEIAAALPKK